MKGNEGMDPRRGQAITQKSHKYPKHSDMYLSIRASCWGGVAGSRFRGLGFGGFGVEEFIISISPMWWKHYCISSCSCSNAGQPESLNFNLSLVPACLSGSRLTQHKRGGQP